MGGCGDGKGELEGWLGRWERWNRRVVVEMGKEE